MSENKLFGQQYIAIGADVTMDVDLLGRCRTAQAGGIVGEAAWIGKVLPFVFSILLIVAPIMGRKGLSSGP